MLIGITGDICAGKSEVARYLCLQGFTKLSLARPGEEKENDDTFDNVEEMVEFVTKRWREKFVTTHIWTSEILDAFSKRPFFLHVNVEAPVLLRWARYCKRENVALEEFAKLSDDYLYSGTAVTRRARVSLVNQTENLELLYANLGNLNLTDPTRLRPSWDAYFMRLANLAALRSNCMKRQVGCVLVRDKRVISTGYNGTPRGLTNCNEGGCARCNLGNSSGQGLTTCLCLHAEENALLEAGRERMGTSSTIYCNTCPCLTCSIKIAQCGIKEVVYSQSYSMDVQSAQVLEAGGCVLRQYSPPSDMM